MRQTILAALTSFAVAEKCFLAYSSGNRNAFILAGRDFDLVDKDVMDCADMFEIQEEEQKYLMATARCMAAKTVNEHDLSYNVYAKDIEHGFADLFISGKIKVKTHAQITESGETHVCELEPNFEYNDEQKRSLPVNATNFFMDSFNTETQEVLILGHGLNVK